jgi:hypothetical protein
MEKFVRGEFYAKQRMKELQNAAQVLGLTADTKISIEELDVEE